MLFPLYDHNPHYRFPWCTLLLIGVNVAAMMWLAQLQPARQENVLAHYGFVPLRLSRLDQGKPVEVQVGQPDARRPRRGAVAARPPIVLAPDRQEIFLSFLTMMFLHGGWFHLVSNMWMLWVFGNNIEDRLGHFVFLGYYLLGGILATLTHWAIEPQSAMPVIGASGAVAAVLGGYAVTYPVAKVRTLVFIGMIFLADLPALLVLGVWFVLQIVQGLGMLAGVDIPIAFWAHIGGFVAGIALIPLAGLGAAPAGVSWDAESDEAFGKSPAARRESQQTGIDRAASRDQRQDRRRSK